MHIKFLALNVNFSSLSFDFLDSTLKETSVRSLKFGYFFKMPLPVI